MKEDFYFILNPDFSDEHEIVLRKSEFNSARTLGFRSEKAAKDIKREITDKIKDSDVKIKVVFRLED